VNQRARLKLAWVKLFQWHRILGIAALSVVAYVLVFVVFGKTDVSGLLPASPAARFHWPDLPYFFVEKAPAQDGGTETYYTVPTRQLTPGEVAQLRGTNEVARPGGGK
jgi:hypothetical protein